MKKYFYLLLGLFLCAHSCCDAATGNLEISEVLAKNVAGLQDEDADFSDWIEIHNNGLDPVELGGLSLTDNANEPTRWIFPSLTLLQPQAFLIVFASSKNRRTANEHLHTNFKLSANGEYVGLYNGTTVLSEFSPMFPPQSADRSFGRDNNGDLRFFASPSPGNINGEGEIPSAFSVTADMDRGFYDNPFAVALNTASVGAKIRYTTDGSYPTATSGTLYTAPIDITTTTVLRAAAFASDLLPSTTSTYSYIFVADVIQQPAIVAGFPNGVKRMTAGIGRRVPMDFEMDPDVVNEYADEIFNAMTSIPTMVLTSPVEELFGDDGPYFAGDSDEDNEIMCSMEILNYGDFSDNEQINVGVEAHSRNRQKRSLRLNFRTEYGEKKWETDFFQKNAPINTDSVIADTFRTLVLRAGNQRSFARSEYPGQTAYTMDEFYRSSQVAMSGLGSHGTFVHLYLNGVYWGVYNVIERPDEEFQAVYKEGKRGDWFFTNHGGAGSADSGRWNYLVETLANKDMRDSSNYAEMQEYLNMEQFADYLILSFWLGVTDWPFNNWYVANRNAVSSLGPTPSEFFAWDGESALDTRRPWIVSIFTGGIFSRRRPLYGASIPFSMRFKDGSNENIVSLWWALFENADFRALLDERVALHTGVGGALSDEMAIQRWNTLNEYVKSAIVGESARWGDSLSSLFKKEYKVTRTRDIDWQNEVDAIRNLLDGNAQQFIDEYNKVVDPSFVARTFSSLLSVYVGFKDLFSNLF